MLIRVKFFVLRLNISSATRKGQNNLPTTIKRNGIFSYFFIDSHFKNFISIFANYSIIFCEKGTVLKITTRIPCSS